MATLIPAHGTPRFIAPANGHAFTLAELQSMVGGYIEMLRTPLVLQDSGEHLLMFLNEDGKRDQLPINGFATHIMRKWIQPFDVIVGDVVLCTRIEAGGDDSDGDTTL